LKRWRHCDRDEAMVWQARQDKNKADWEANHHPSRSPVPPTLS
jgi:hypothetical protein